jgi:hypothetical protein
MIAQVYLDLGKAILLKVLIPGMGKWLLCYWVDEDVPIIANLCLH